MTLLNFKSLGYFLLENNDKYLLQIMATKAPSMKKIEVVGNYGLVEPISFNESLTHKIKLINGESCNYSQNPSIEFIEENPFVICEVKNEVDLLDFNKRELGSKFTLEEFILEDKVLEYLKIKLNESKLWSRETIFFFGNEAKLMKNSNYIPKLFE